MELLLFLPPLLVAVVVHEVAHAWMALRQGDDTAARLGRVSLRPLRHLDFFGSFLVPVILWLGNAPFLFGWAKPVPVNPSNFRDHRRGDILVSLAGPASNFLLAAASVVAAVLFVWVGRVAGPVEPGVSFVAEMARFSVFINLLLGIFNLIPIPPLDGSHVLYHLLPEELGLAYRRAGRFGILLLVGLLFFVPGAFDVMLWPVAAIDRVALDLIRLAT
ncbi:MAG: site-2 protease family protein [Gemmatimonadota bacterium]